MEKEMQWTSLYMGHHRHDQLRWASSQLPWCNGDWHGDRSLSASVPSLENERQGEYYNNAHIEMYQWAISSIITSAMKWMVITSHKCAKVYSNWKHFFPYKVLEIFLTSLLSGFSYCRYNSVVLDVRSKRCLRPLEHWDVWFESHWKNYVRLRSFFVCVILFK